MPNYNERITKFQRLLGEAGVDVAFVPITTDLDYLMGVPRDIPNFGATLHPGGWLEGAWLTPTHEPVLALPRMTAQFGGLDKLETVNLRVLGDWDDPAAMVSDILQGFGASGDVTIAVSNFAHGESVVNIQKIVPDATFVSATEILRKLRVVKDQEEIDWMKRAGAITEAAFADVLKTLKFGMTELDIIAEVDYQLKKHGSLGPSFTTSLYNSGPTLELVFGERQKTWHRELQPPASILFDFGAALDGMCYDFGRTVSFGEPSAEQIKVHRLIMESQRAGIAALKAGAMTCEQVDAAARAVIEDAGYGETFRHRLGHAIGMDVHEPPFLTKTDTTLLLEGMLFTIEPSIMQFGDFSARVEDVVVARPGGGEPLTTGFQDLIVVA